MTVLPVQNADVPPQDRSAGPGAEETPELGESLLRYAELGGFTLAVETHAWYAAASTVTGAEDARSASTVLAEVRGCDLSLLREAAERLAEEAALREPASVAEVLTLIGLLRRVRETATTLRSGAYEADLDALAAATANGSWRRERGLKLSWGRRRKLRAEARRLAVADRPRRDALHAALVAAAAERAEWQELAPASGTVARPVDPELLDVTGQSAEALTGGLRELSKLVGRELMVLSYEELADLVAALAADEGTLYRLPELRALRTELEAAGLDELLAELAEAKADRAAAQAAYAELLRKQAETAEAAAEESEAAEAADEVDAAAETEEPGEDEVAEDEAKAVLAEPAIVIPAPAREPELETLPQVEVEVEVEVAAETEVEVAAETEVEVAAEAEVEIQVVAEAAAEDEVVAELAADAEAETELEAEAAPEPEAEAGAETHVEAAAAADVEADAQPAAVEADAESVTEAEAEAEADVEPAAEVEPVADVEPEPEPVAELAVEAEPVAEEAAPVAVEPEVAPEPEPVAEVAPPVVDVAAEPTAPAGKPDLAPGRPITAYSAEDLVALVRWLDTDGTDRSEDELLRAAMKELGFARLGPRIKEALGTAVTSARA
ncbi:hypothetical protein [Streptomyces tateyamensis]|uniref:hypothetical protein n=1 Tax=Streptomyces tateyamensis TaxID=565073 RepID=UPI0011B5AD26|nr:hypothetical protein [Streptomyces tateyamensis]